MELWAFIAIFFGSLILFLIFGLPISFTLGGLAAVFSLYLWGFKGTLVIASMALGQLTSFLLIAAPLFILMGIFLEQSGVADELYEAVYRWFGGLKGGLAMGTVVICAVFAAMAGTSSAATITMGIIALPSMLKRGYDKIMVTGTVSAGGALGILIPPSIIMILYASMTDLSVGKLFFGGMFPGILLAVLFIIYIAVRCRIRPAIGPGLPEEERYNWREKFTSLRGVILPIILILLVLGTIYTGIATPTEAAGIGAAGAMVCAAIHRKFNWRMFRNSCMRAMGISAFMLWIVFAAVTFSSVFIRAGASEYLTSIMVALPLPRYAILAMTQVVFMILGCFIDPMGIIMICTPIFVPIITALGFDPLWFGVLFTINMEMAYITPPFGFNLFYMKGIVPPEISMGDIYRSIIPFVLIQLVCLVIIVVFPQIALWLPNQMITR